MSPSKTNLGTSSTDWVLSFLLHLCCRSRPGRCSTYKHLVFPSGQLPFWLTKSFGISQSKIIEVLSHWEESQRLINYVDQWLTVTWCDSRFCCPSLAILPQDCSRNNLIKSEMYNFPGNILVTQIWLMDVIHFVSIILLYQYIVTWQPARSTENCFLQAWIFKSLSILIHLHVWPSKFVWSNIVAKSYCIW